LITGVNAQAMIADDPVPSITVHFGDLDVNSAGGAETLYKRIKGAARTVCDESTADRMARNSLWYQCYDSAVARAVAQVNNGRLTAVFNEKNPRVG
jgi:UrcA family protein